MGNCNFRIILLNSLDKSTIQWYIIRMMTEHDKDELRIIGICLTFAFFMGLFFGEGSFTFTLFVALGTYLGTVWYRYKRGYYYVEHRTNTISKTEAQRLAPKD